MAIIAASKSKVMLARLVIVLVVALIVAGSYWYGFSADTRQRFLRNLQDRPFGPLGLRFVFQPLMAASAAVIDGIRDGRSGRSPYLWAILTNPKERRERLFEGLVATARIVLLGLVVDVIYQATVLASFYPGEAAVVAVVLVIPPYVVLRGPVARLTRLRRRGGHK